jgi:hypothetical protein
MQPAAEFIATGARRAAEENRGTTSEAFVREAMARGAGDAPGRRG